MVSSILAPVSAGELVDKLTILKIKIERMTDPEKLVNVRHEHAELTAIADANLPVSEGLTALWDDLFAINATLWDIEDDIRECETNRDFGDKFIGLARAVYQTNDKRAALKKQINLLLGSLIIEEKSYYGSV